MTYNQELPNRCCDCYFFEERHGPDNPLYYCRHTEWDLMEFGWSEGISPVYGIWNNCPLKTTMDT